MNQWRENTCRSALCKSHTPVHKNRTQLGQNVPITSGKHVHVIYTSLNPTFVQQKWDMQG